MERADEVLPSGRSIAVLPPIAASTCATRLVGTGTHGTPRRYVAAAKPAASVVQPPPSATIVPSRPRRSSSQRRETAIRLTEPVEGKGPDRCSRASGRSCASTATARSSRSAAASRPTPPASRPRPPAWRPVIPADDSSRRSTQRSAEDGDHLPQGKNLVGAFHWPARTLIDPALLETLPEPQRREGHGRGREDRACSPGEPLWELPDDELVRRCAAYKAAVCLRDPHDSGERKMLNLGHTFAHALEAAAGYEGVTHGQRGRARPARSPPPLRPGHRPSWRSSSQPKPVRVDRDRAWDALLRDKKGAAASSASSFSATTARRRVPADDVRASSTADRGEFAPVRVLVLNGVNLNVLGRRDPTLYGGLSIAELEIAHLRVGERARADRPVPPDEQRGRVRRLVPRRARQRTTA